MIETFIASVYITFVCWCFGSCSIHIMRKLSGNNKTPFVLPFIITCFTGLAIIGILFTSLSLFMPIGNFFSQVLLLLPSLYWGYIKKKSPLSLLKKIKEKSKEYSPLLLVASFSGILLIFVMHAHLVNHPDTITYHAQNIQWIEKYHAIPGIANLYLNYGIQSSWFVLSALFSFSFTGTSALTFINAVILTWFIIFVCQQIQRSLTRKTRIIDGISWLLLLGFSFWSYTQIRLTASSGSPDFIAALYIWLVIYLFINRPTIGNPPFYSLLLFLGCFAVTIKLSALPCLLFGLYTWVRQMKINSIKKIIFPSLILFIVLAPYLARNVASSGYLLFPSSFPDLFAVKWKVPDQALSLTQQYITAYARTNVNYDTNEIKAVMKMNIADWLPTWWQLRSLADKIILLSCPCLLILSLCFVKKIIRKENVTILKALLFSLAGLLFWFMQAPDPRFGFGFLVPFSGLLLYLLVNRGEAFFLKKQWLSYGLVLFSIAIFSYTAYRCMYFFNARNILVPAGVLSVDYEIKECNGVKINIPSVEQDCGDIPVPCTVNPCSNFIPIGNDIRDGFKAR